jgi:DNA-binding NarL/FixJ family response regulator
MDGPGCQQAPAVVTGKAETSDELLRLIDQAPPDAAPIDIRLPLACRGEGLQAARPSGNGTQRSGW